MPISKDGRKVMGARPSKARAIMTRAEAMRVDRFVMKVGKRTLAAARLGVGLGTLEIASLEGGALGPETKDRLMAALDREEAA